MKSELTDLGIKYGTDKSTYHNFTDFYDEHLHKHKESFKNILEIGVFFGSSLKMWKEYFTNCKIFGIDTENKTEFNDERTTVYICDQTDFNRINQLFEDDYFDLIIDDGCHNMREQQLSIMYFSKKLKRGGIYILEDLHTSVLNHNKINQQTTLSLIESLKDNLTFSSEYINEVDYKNLKSQFTEIHIFEQPQDNHHGKSITSLMYKK